MADRPTFSEMFAYRPLVFAWLWELVCILGALVCIAVYDSMMGFMALIIMGVVPFMFVFLKFTRARKRGELGAKPGNLVE